MGCTGSLAIDGQMAGLPVLFDSLDQAQQHGLYHLSRALAGCIRARRQRPRISGRFKMRPRLVGGAERHAQEVECLRVTGLLFGFSDVGWY